MCYQNINFWLIRSHVTQPSEITFYEIDSMKVKGEANLDQYQYLGNCPPTPPLTQH